MTQPDKEEKMLFCNCSNCEGKKDEHFDNMLDPEGDCISRYCADIVFLEDWYFEVLSRENRETNADFDLSVYGAEEFHKRNFVSSKFEVVSKCLNPKI